MIQLTNKEKCCACGACVQKCPKRAISFTKDEFEIEYPVVDQGKCINCGLCEAVCPYLTHNACSNINDTYAVILKEKKHLVNSASGGAFYGIAEGFLSVDIGTVYGCAYDDKLKCKHIGVNDICNLPKLQGSKYVRSEVKVFQEIFDKLRTGERVLFSGTPCQCNAMKLYCQQYLDRLYTVELICHGVIDPSYWESYIDHMGNKYKARILDYQFRCKDLNKSFFAKLVFEKNKTNGNLRKFVLYESPALSYYYNHFLNGFVFRENCYSCPFANSSRGADITIGDYWGYKGKIDNSRGISVLILNTDKGRLLFEQIKELFDYEKKDFDDAAKCNEQLNKPFDRNKQNYEILKIWKEKGPSYMERNHHRKHWKAWLLSKISRR